MDEKRRPVTSSQERSDRPKPTLARVLANPWRARIIGELYLRPMSPKGFTQDVGGEKSTISRHFRDLASWGYIELIEEKRGGARHGGVERIYRTLQRDQLDTEDWKLLTQAEREEKSANMIAFYFRRVDEAVQAKTFDADPDRHFTWDAISLDGIAWTQLMDRLRELLFWLPELELEAAERMRESGEEPIPTTVGLAGFRSPTEAQRKALRTPRDEDR